MTVDSPELQPNPFRPGAGHMPPYLAGRETEKEEFAKLLDQEVILENLVLSGLRGVGKTVLMEALKPMAVQKGWLWVNADLSESTSVSEATLAVRLITDLSVVTASFPIGDAPRGTGFRAEPGPARMLDYQALFQIWESTPGLAADKLKAVLETVWAHIEPQAKRGIVFAYDEAQNLADHAARDQYPLSLLLDVFQSIQRKGIRFLLLLVGLPTLFPKLVEARTFAERMFHVLFLDRLNSEDTEAAINMPIDASKGPVNFSPESIQAVYVLTMGYPYFIQFVCKEAFDVWTQNIFDGVTPRSIPATEIMQKLDNDFFVGRWARATDRQRELLGVIALLENCTDEFTVQEVAEKSVEVLERRFSASHVNQMLSTLCDAGLVYKNRWGKYSLAVPLLDGFIRRQAVAVED